MSVGSVFQKLIRRRLQRQGFRRCYVEVNGHTLHYFDGAFEGQLGTLVVVHGLGASGTTLSPIFRRLASHFRRVIAVDLLGHGDNPPPIESVTVEDVYESLRLQLLAICDEPFILYGSSLGGGLALRFTVEHPESVSRLALVSPAGAPLRRRDISSLRNLFRPDQSGGMRPLIKALFHKPPWYGSLLGRELQREMSRPIVRSILAQLEDIPTLTVQEVAQLTCPILLIWGQSEAVLPRHCLTWFLTHLPDSAYIEQPFGYGHSPHLESAQDLRARLLHFFRKSAT